MKQYFYSGKILRKTEEDTIYFHGIFVEEDEERFPTHILQQITRELKAESQNKDVHLEQFYLIN